MVRHVLLVGLIDRLTISLWRLWQKEWLLILIVLLGLSVRAYQFGSIPGGMNQDEASLAYDAYSILHYGEERNGFRIPLMLIAFGSGMSGSLAAYLSMPFIAILDLNPVSARMLNLTVGVLSIVLLYLFVQKIADRRTGLIAAFLLATNPWHILMSRWGMDCNLFPGLFLLGCVLLVYAKDRPRLLPWSFFIFGLSLYSYGVAYFFVPFFLFFTSLYLLFFRITRWDRLLIACCVFGITAVPIGMFLLINQLDLPSLQTPFFSIPNLFTTPRYQSASSFFSADFAMSVGRNLQVLWNLLLTQNDGLIWNVIPEYGMLYKFSLPFVGIGLVVALTYVWQSMREKAWHPVFFVLLWLIASIALAGIMEVNVNRINIIFIPLIICIALFIASFRNMPIVVASLIGLYAFSFTSFTRAYFTTYPDQIGPAFFESLGDATKFAAASTTRSICFTDSINMAEMNVVFWLKVDPREFSSTAVYADPNALYRHTSSFGRYRFGLHNCQDPSIGAFVFMPHEEAQFSTTEYQITQFKNYWVALRE
jgi:4-amino-4-deoxy-L-arabinose transferase-like glycosyltransferase